MLYKVAYSAFGHYSPCATVSVQLDGFDPMTIITYCTVALAKLKHRDSNSFLQTVILLMECRFKITSFAYAVVINLGL
jgi:hypothetical protein